MLLITNSLGSTVKVIETNTMSRAENTSFFLSYGSNDNNDNPEITTNGKTLSSTCMSSVNNPINFSHFHLSIVFETMYPRMCTCSYQHMKVYETFSLVLFKTYN